jgi:hypothetical protein
MLPKHVSTLLTTGNEWTRIFHVSGEEVVVVRHAPVTDGLEVTLNGILVRTIEEPGNKYWFASKKRKFVVKITSTSGWLLAKTGLGNFTYELEVDGTGIPENNERLSVASAAADLGSSKFPSSATIRVSDFVIQGDGVVWYLIQWPELHVHVHRRYRDFWLLYSQVCSAYRGTHLYSSVPEPPPREIATLSANRSPAFLNTRMKQLEVFLRRLNAFPGIKEGRNPDVLEFLGIGSGRSGVFETSVVFAEGKLGMKIKQPVSGTPSDGSTCFSAQVSDILVDSTDSQAGRMDPERIRVGDMITRVGGESALLAGYDKVLSLLQKAEARPIVVHLLGIRDFTMPT